MSLYAPSLNYLWKVGASFGLDPKPLFVLAGLDTHLGTASVSKRLFQISDSA